MDRRAFIASGLGAMTVPALSRARQVNAVAREAPTSLRGTTLLPLSVDDLQMIAARPIRILATYSELAGGADPNQFVRAALGDPFVTLENSGCFAVYATMVAFNMAPYGDPGIAPITATLSELVSAPVMTCGQYCKLTLLFSLLADAELCPPDAADWESAKPTMHCLVWTEASPLNVGFHLQMIVTNVMDGAYLLLDPTYGFVMSIPYTAEFVPGPDTAANAATLLSNSIPADHLVAVANGVVNDGGNTTARAHVLPTMYSGALGPNYVYYDPSSGSDGWDSALGGLIGRMG